MVIKSNGSAYDVMSGETPVATATPAEPLETTLPSFSFEQAERASITGLEKRECSTVFRTCFVCGPDREEGDGLRLFADTPAEVIHDGTPQPVAVSWTPFVGFSSDGENIDEAHTWAAMDCPSAMALNNDGSDLEPLLCLLGRFRNTILRTPKVNERCVVVAKMRHSEGRKFYSDVALFGHNEEVLACGLTTWISIKQ